MQRMNNIEKLKKKYGLTEPKRKPTPKKPAPSRRPGTAVNRGPAPIGRGGQRRPMPKGRMPARTPKRPAVR